MATQLEISLDVSNMLVSQKEATHLDCSYSCSNDVFDQCCWSNALELGDYYKCCMAGNDLDSSCTDWEDWCRFDRFELADQMLQLLSYLARHQMGDQMALEFLFLVVHNKMEDHMCHNQNIDAHLG